MSTDVDKEISKNIAFGIEKLANKLPLYNFHFIYDEFFSPHLILCWLRSESYIISKGNFIKTGYVDISKVGKCLFTVD